MATLSKDLGGVTAYAAAVNRGYTGTREEFETLMASYATVAQNAAESASTASTAATTATGAASTATTKASEASTSAGTASTAAATATTKAGEAATSAATANTAKNDAVTAKNEAVAAKDTTVSTAAGFTDTVEAAVSEVNLAGQNQKELAKAQAINSEAWAVGQREGADVGVSDETYHNNAKYYATQAGSSATAAATSESNAAASATSAATSETNAAASATAAQSAADTAADDTAAALTSQMESYVSSAAASASAAAQSAASLTVDSALSSTSTNPVQNKVVEASISDLNNQLGDVVDVLSISKITPAFSWEGYYYINSSNLNKIAISETASSATMLTRPIKVNKGDQITVETCEMSGRAVIAFCNSEGTTFTSCVDGSSPHSIIEYSATSDKSQYFVVGCRASKISDVKVTIVPGSSDVIEDVRSDINQISTQNSTPYYYGEKAGGNLSVCPTSYTASCTVEMLVKISPVESTHYVYGATTRTFGINANVSGCIIFALNVGNYENVVLTDAFNKLLHIVLTYDSTAKTKAAYVNGVKVGESTGTGTVTAVVLSETFTDDISVYQYRIWDDVLTQDDIQKLYNSGYSNYYKLPNPMRDGLLSELISSNITSTKWENTVVGANDVTFSENVVLLKDDPSSMCEDLNYVKEYVTTQEDNPIREVIQPEFQVVSAGRGSHDCTIIDGYLVSFNKPSDGYAQYIDISNMTNVGSKSINFVESNTRELEMKSADYKYGKLLIGNGRAIKYEETDYTEQGARLYVFYDALAWRTSSGTVTFENCGDYDVIDVSDLGYKIYGFWGAYEDTVFVSCNLLNDIYQIQLGKGTVNYGSGTYTAADSDRYNGSYKIINHWHQNGYFGSLAAHGGQYYKGHLYLAINDTSVCRVLKCRLMQDGSILFDYLDFVSYMEAMPTDLVWKYLDGLCIHNGSIYVQPLTKNNSSAHNNDIIIGDC